MSDDDMEWASRLAESAPESKTKEHAAVARDVDMLRLNHANGVALIGYSYIRRIELIDDTLYIFASECIAQIVGHNLSELVEPLQRHSLHALSVGRDGVTHITIKDKEDEQKTVKLSAV